MTDHATGCANDPEFCQCPEHADADHANTASRTDEQESRRWFELWKRIEGGVNQASTWMVWEVEPISGGEHWFSTEQEAREFIDQETDARLESKS